MGDIFRLTETDLPRRHTAYDLKILGTGKRSIPVNIQRKTVVQQQLIRVKPASIAPGLEHIFVACDRQGP